MKRACLGLEDWFLSINREDHAAAAELCATCPALEWCRRETASALKGPYGIGVHGTWAGNLYDGGRRIMGRASVGNCPQCGATDGKPCRSPKGIAIGTQHRARTYGHPTCPQCHQEFVREHSRVSYCSKECSKIADRERRRRYELKRRKVENNCIECQAPTSGTRCVRHAAIRASHISHGLAVA